MRSVYLNSLARALPSRREENDSITLGYPPAECERIVSKTGVRSRPVASESEFTSDLAETAIKKLLLEANMQASAVETLLVCTQTPDHLIPGVSSRLHGTLGLSNDCLTLDINQGCSGFVVGTQLTRALIQSGRTNVILVNADTYSRLIRPDDLPTRVLFGDAAAASLFSNAPHGFKLRYVRSFSDGSGYDLFVARGSALRHESCVDGGIHMDGPGILNFALKVVPESILLALEDNNLRIENIRMVLFHQANHFVVGQLSKKLRLSPEQVPENCELLGNTVSASIPLLLWEKSHELMPGDLVLVAGFGVGLSWGCALFERVASSNNEQ